MPRALCEVPKKQTDWIQEARRTAAAGKNQPEICHGHPWSFFNHITERKASDEADYLNDHLLNRITIKADRQVGTPCYHQHTLRPTIEEERKQPQTARRTTKILENYVLVPSSRTAAWAAPLIGTATDIEVQKESSQWALYVISRTAMPRTRQNLKISTYWWSEDIRVTGPGCFKVRRRIKRARKWKIRDTLNDILYLLYREGVIILKKIIKNAKTHAWRKLIKSPDQELWRRPFRIVLGKERVKTLLSMWLWTWRI